MSVGITIIVILLIPILFQVVMLSIKQDKRYREMKEILKRIEDKIGK